VSRTQPRQGTQRQQAIDATRGIAMLFVCLSHFAYAYFGELPSHALESHVATRIALIASPTFVSLSGILLGFLFRANPSGMPALGAKLVDRGLFLLTVGHVLIALAHIPTAGGLGPAFEWGFITDAIGIGLLVGPGLVQHVPSRRRLVLAAALYALSWVTVVAWNPEASIIERIKEYLVGSAIFLPGHPKLVFECFPILPWLAVYLAATVLGEALGERYQASRRAAAATLVTRLAIACLLGAVAFKIVPRLLTAIGVLPPDILIWTLGWPFQKQPPAPTYLGLYAGAGLLLLRTIMAVDEHPRARGWLAPAAMLGRVSLATFIAQYYVYFTVLKLWSPPYTPWWPLLFVISFAIVFGISTLWNRLGNNEIFSIGYRWLGYRWLVATTARAEPAPPPLDRYRLRE
jgi:uncharacterized membrane protein